MEFFSHILIGWIWLDTAGKALTEKSSGNTQYSAQFLDNKVELMKFFYKYELSKTTSLSESLMNVEEVTLPEGTFQF